MGRLADLRKKYGDKIGDVIDDVSALTPLSDLQIRNAYSDRELEELRGWLVEVRNATSENEKQAMLLRNAGQLLKLLKTLGVAI